MLTQRARAISSIFLDVDGVLTTGQLIYGAAGEERKVFHSQDGYAMRAATKLGLQVGFCSGRTLPAVERRASELELGPCFLGINDKRACIEQWLQETNTTWEQVAFMGDDLPDAPCLAQAGLSIAPADANPLVRRRVHYITRAGGGAGAVAEALYAILSAQGKTLAGQSIDYAVHG